MSTYKQSKQIYLFIILVFVISALIQFQIIKNELNSIGQVPFQSSKNEVLLLMWIPALVSIFIGNFKNKFTRFFLFNYLNILIAIVSPLIVYFLILTYVHHFDSSLFLDLKKNGIFFLSANLRTYCYWILFFLVSAMGEEIGWRGFLYPLLAKKYSTIKASLIIGIIWGLWHWPLILYSNYSVKGFANISVIYFTALTLTVSLLMGHMFKRSQSIYPFIVLHALHNFVFYVLLPNSVLNSHLATAVSEFGYIPPISYLIIFIFLNWIFREK